LSDANISKIELCRKIKEIITGFTFLESELGRDPDQRNYMVSNEKIEKAGFAPNISLEMGLRELIKFIPMYSQKLYSNI
jgi:hypothetical protein